MLSAAVRGIVWSLFATVAAAQNALLPPHPAEPIALYAAGQYEAAIALGESRADGPSLSAAARAALAIANLSETPCLECLQRAERLARAAIAANDRQQEAYIFLAAALGYQARIVGIVRAYWGEYAERARAALDAALALAPDDPWALAASGAWHIEVVRSGGKVLGQALYGGDFETGMAQFERALATGPDNPVIRFQFALTLSSYDFEAYRERIRALLAESVALQPRTAYERDMAARARLLMQLYEEDTERFLDQVARYQGYP